MALSAPGRKVERLIVFEHLLPVKMVSAAMPQQGAIQMPQDAAGFL